MQNLQRWFANTLVRQLVSINCFWTLIIWRSLRRDSASSHHVLSRCLDNHIWVGRVSRFSRMGLHPQIYSLPHITSEDTRGLILISIRSINVEILRRSLLGKRKTAFRFLRMKLEDQVLRKSWPCRQVKSWTGIDEWERLKWVIDRRLGWDLDL